jgi:predicted nucleic acid-binding protein
MDLIDATVLLLLLDPDAKGPPVTKPRERIQHLVEELDKSGTRIAIPTPALAEVLIKMDPGAVQRTLQKINELSVFEVLPFDQRAAVELALQARQEMKGPPQSDVETRAKLKFDRQIVAIAKVIGASTVYSDDGPLRTRAERHGLRVKGTGDLPLPPEDPQQELFEGPGEGQGRAGEVAPP